MVNVIIDRRQKNCKCGQPNSLKHLIFDCKQAAAAREEFLLRGSEIRERLPKKEEFNGANQTTRLGNAYVAKMQHHYDVAQNTWYYKKLNPLWESYLTNLKPAPLVGQGGGR